MSHSQIAEELERDLNTTSNGTYASERDRHNKSGNGGFMTDLIDAQQALIRVHHNFLHDNDIRALAVGQRAMIQAQSSVLDSLGVFG